MRQVGTLQTAGDANRFAAYLVTQGVEAHAEADGDGWAIWVRDENDMETAKESFLDFSADPDSARYEGVERTADDILKEKEKLRRKARENVHEMRGRWRQPGTRKAPVTFVLIVLSVAVTMLSSMANPESRVTRQLQFCDPFHSVDPGWNGDVLVDIRKGELWRLITPIFLHYLIIHVGFNMLMLYYLGAQIEDRKGAVYYAILILVIALVSNVAQAWGRNPWFGGMSGVDYGLFGYLWMKTLYEPESGMFVSRGTIIILMAWFFLCLAGVMDKDGAKVANIAHGAGLVVGVAIGYAPILWKLGRNR